MATVLYDGQEAQVEDGSQILEACESLGVPFGCQDGLCGTCIVTVDEGMENLSGKNDKEQEMGLAGDQRLACQCVLNGGSISLSTD